MKKLLVTATAIILALSMCLGCNPAPAPAESTPDVPAQSTPANTPDNNPEPTAPESSSDDDQPCDSTPGESSTPAPDEEKTLNGVPLTDYTIVYSHTALDYTVRAAEYICDRIFEITGERLTIAKDNEGKGTFNHEIVVGEANRDISRALDADTEGVEFAFLSSGAHVAMEADYFVIAAAAYYFVETYIAEDGAPGIPSEITVCEPIVEKAENFIFLIGDGMGIYQTLLFEAMSASSKTNYSDNEALFYGYLLPYMGFARTFSYSGTTDSAAAGTALATGHKTINGYIGKDRNLNDVLSLTEIAGSLGKATAVMSTEPSTGATPGSFSAHANNRNDSSTILSTQNALSQKYGTIIKCNFDFYDAFGIRALENNITSTLDALSKDEDGFFLMYEEAYIDKHCHSNNMNKTFAAMVRFNQAIGRFMEYAFYNPNTFLLITADHETGNLLPNSNRGFTYHSGDHSSQYVPVFAYGDGAELFDGKVIENIQIPKTIAALWGIEIVGTDNAKYPALKKK